MAISTQVALEHLIFKWQRIAQEKPSDNMIYHAPTIRAFLGDLRVIAESNPEGSPGACAPVHPLVGQSPLNMLVGRFTFFRGN